MSPTTLRPSLANVLHQRNVTPELHGELSSSKRPLPVSEGSPIVAPITSAISPQPGNHGDKLDSVQDILRNVSGPMSPMGLKPSAAPGHLAEAPAGPGPPVLLHPTAYSAHFPAYSQLPGPMVHRRSEPILPTVQRPEYHAHHHPNHPQNHPQNHGRYPGQLPAQVHHHPHSYPQYPPPQNGFHGPPTSTPSSGMRSHEPPIITPPYVNTNHPPRAVENYSPYPAPPYQSPQAPAQHGYPAHAVTPLNNPPPPYYHHPHPPCSCANHPQGGRQDYPFPQTRAGEGGHQCAVTDHDQKMHGYYPRHPAPHHPPAHHAPPQYPPSGTPGVWSDPASGPVCPPQNGSESQLPSSHTYHHHHHHHHHTPYSRDAPGAGHSQPMNPNIVPNGGTPYHTDRIGPALTAIRPYPKHHPYSDPHFGAQNHPYGHPQHPYDHQPSWAQGGYPRPPYASGPLPTGSMAASHMSTASVPVGGMGHYPSQTVTPPTSVIGHHYLTGRSEPTTSSSGSGSRGGSNASNTRGGCGSNSNPSRSPQKDIKSADIKSLTPTSDAWQQQTKGAGQKRYICTECPKRFTRPSSLKTHLNSHTGQKPFLCHCGRSFSVLSNLRRHERNGCCGAKATGGSRASVSASASAS
ncbi:uncharacterized protein EV422DRAFT_21943 [Fimicolochytrium jonesii]|uniref:uncharacterized protein n=1 Tax=Fimicolochytrium jonesii TaxID=1396493 RepID=UPI0022FEE5F8|nr:uncharacterized protein EV422DRAFT_21943 [Fimicolochytrium jonesii]KAI8827009.1 hypothetical protein EV422DRAFT_21943 [Fimicolochytrium jonesii]